MTPLYHWIRREENQQADALSKIAAAAFTMRTESEVMVRQWLDEQGLRGTHPHQYHRTRVVAPRFDKISLWIAEMQRSKQPACIVVTRWSSAAWRVHLLDVSEDTLVLGRMKLVLESEHFESGAELEHARWGMEAHVIGTKR